MRRQAGFSLVELMIIIVVVAILSVTFMTRMPPPTTFQVDGVKEAFIQDLRLTTALSMSQNQRYRIVVAASSYQIQDQNGTPITHPETSGTAITYPTGVTLIPSGTVIFDALGRPYNGSGVALSTALVFTISSSTASLTATVSPQTGFIQ